MRMTRVIGIMWVALLCGCALTNSGEKCPAAWEQTMEVATAKVKAGDYAYIIDHLLAPESVAAAQIKYGAAKWREEYPQKELRHLAYYFDWLRKREVRVEGEKVFVTGEAGCYATFIQRDGGFYILDFGQIITSM